MALFPIVLALVLVYIWAGWRVCEKVGWPGWYAFLLLVPLIYLGFLPYLLVKALRRVGRNPWFALLVVVPPLGPFILLALALSRWPEEDTAPVSTDKLPLK